MVGSETPLTSCFRLYGGQRNAPNITLMTLLLYAKNIFLSIVFYNFPTKQKTHVENGERQAPRREVVRSVVARI